MLSRLALLPRQPIQFLPTQPEQVHQRLLLCLGVGVFPIDLHACKVRRRAVGEAMYLRQDYRDNELSGPDVA
jgi:hypothetical protein